MRGACGLRSPRACNRRAGAQGVRGGAHRWRTVLQQGRLLSLFSRRKGVTASSTVLGAQISPKYLPLAPRRAPCARASRCVVASPPERYSISSSPPPPRKMCPRLSAFAPRSPLVCAHRLTAQVCQRYALADSVRHVTFCVLCACATPHLRWNHRRRRLDEYTRRSPALISTICSTYLPGAHFTLRSQPPQHTLLAAKAAATQHVSHTAPRVPCVAAVVSLALLLDSISITTTTM